MTKRNILQSSSLEMFADTSKLNSAPTSSASNDKSFDETLNEIVLLYHYFKVNSDKLNWKPQSHDMYAPLATSVNRNGKKRKELIPKDPLSGYGF